MKANRSVVAPLLAAGLSLLAAACSEPRVLPKPAPTATPAIAERPTPTPPPPPALPRPRPDAGWRDAPITAGDWRWAIEGTRSVARFGGNALILSCDRSAATVTLLRLGAVPPPVPAGDPAAVSEPVPTVPMTILTSTLTRPASGEAIAGPPPVIALPLSARDPVLDAMAFSRGRFAVETAGLPTLYVPSWPEVGRVIEDCR